MAIDRQEITEEGIFLQGSIDLAVLCVTENDETPYASIREQIPYEYTLNVAGMEEQDQTNIQSEIEQLQVNLLEGEEMDIKAVLSFSTTVMKNVALQAITQVTEQEMDSAVLAKLPGAVIYIAAPGDDLWSIGRRYHMPVKSVRELNALESDELQPGQKVLLVKGLA